MIIHLREREKMLLRREISTGQLCELQLQYLSLNKLRADKQTNLNEITYYNTLEYLRLIGNL